MMTKCNTECNMDCKSCESDHSICGQMPQKSPMNEHSNIKKVIGVVSGKGGVGKSSVASMMAVATQRTGKRAAILDADITGPSIPKAFGISEKAKGNETMLLPEITKTGIRVMSINLLLEKDTDPVVWRGPVLGNVVQQFWSDVVWGDIDVMFVDMPPGTGDVVLTAYQSLPLDGIIIVTSPQELVSMIVEKAVNMADMMDIPVLGIVENMSYFKCPNCSVEHSIFGESHIEETAKAYGIDKITRLPLDPGLSTAFDRGTVEYYTSRKIESFAEKILG